MPLPFVKHLSGFAERLFKCTVFSAVAVISLALASCVSYEPRLLVPDITLSAADIQLPSAQPQVTNGVDFGLEVSANESDSLSNIEILPGVRVRRLQAGGPAAQAGILSGDVILRIDGIETNQPDVLQSIASNSDENEFLFELRRNTAVIAATVIARPRQTSIPPRELYRIDPIASRASYRTEIIEVAETGKTSAVAIVAIDNDSPLARTGLNIGDVILALDGQAVHSAQELINRFNNDYEPGESVTLQVYQADNEQLVQQRLKLWDPGRYISRISLWPLLQYRATLDPPTNNFTLLDFWLFSFYNYTRVEGERAHSILGLFKFSSDYGDLVEVPQ